MLLAHRRGRREISKEIRGAALKLTALPVFQNNANMSMRKNRTRAL